ncbi:MAG: hypothetical protein M0Z94_00385 [Dehalococcoidales bacterium]|nr:hypothetical protein [Dehalococcoidales bacterium]
MIAKEHAPIEQMAVAQTDAPETKERLCKIVAEAMPDLEILTYRAGSVVGALAGPGVVALVFVRGHKPE